MANVNAILAIIAAALAALTATILVGTAVLVPAFFAIGAGIFVAIKWDGNKLVLASGIIAALAGLLAAMGAIGAITGEDGGLDFSALSSWASALAILALLEVVAVTLKQQWGDLDQMAAIGLAVALALAVVFAFIFPDQLTNQGNWPAYVVAVLSLLGLYPAIRALKA